MYTLHTYKQLYHSFLIFILRDLRFSTRLLSSNGLAGIANREGLFMVKARRETSRAITGYHSSVMWGGRRMNRWVSLHKEGWPVQCRSHCRVRRSEIQLHIITSSNIQTHTVLAAWALLDKNSYFVVNVTCLSMAYMKSTERQLTVLLS